MAVSGHHDRPCAGGTLIRKARGTCAGPKVAREHQMQVFAFALSALCIKWNTHYSRCNDRHLKPCKVVESNKAGNPMGPERHGTQRNHVAPVSLPNGPL